MGKIFSMRMLQVLVIASFAGHALWCVWTGAPMPFSINELLFAGAGLVLGELYIRGFVRFTIAMHILSAAVIAAIVFHQNLANLIGFDALVNPMTTPFACGFAFGSWFYIGLKLSQMTQRQIHKIIETDTRLQEFHNGLYRANADDNSTFSSSGGQGKDSLLKALQGMPEPSPIEPLEEVVSHSPTLPRWHDHVAQTTTSAAAPVAAPVATPKLDTVEELGLTNVETLVETPKVTIQFGLVGDQSYFVVTSKGLTISQLDRPDGLFKRIQAVSGVVYSTEAKSRNLGEGRKQMTLKLEGDHDTASAGLREVVESDTRFQ